MFDTILLGLGVGYLLRIFVFTGPAASTAPGGAGAGGAGSGASGSSGAPRTGAGAARSDAPGQNIVGDINEAIALAKQGVEAAKKIRDLFPDGSQDAPRAPDDTSGHSGGSNAPVGDGSADAPVETPDGWVDPGFDP